MLLKCGVGEDSLRVPWTARRCNQSILKELSPGCSLEGLMLKLNSNTLATWCEELTHLKRPRCWEKLKVGREGDDRGWDGWMASPTQKTWVWVNSESWRWTGRPGMLQSRVSQRVGHDWVTALTDWNLFYFLARASQVVLVVKNLPVNTGANRDTGSIPRSGRSPGAGNGSPLQHSCPENPRDRGAWWATHSPWGHKESDTTDHIVQ